MGLGPAADRDRTWNQLPPLEGANRLGEPKPAAQVLSEAPDGKPLLVVQDAGGRVMAFAGDTTWHWWMEGFESQHKQFWRQVVLWLAQGRNGRGQRVDQVGPAPIWAAPKSRVHRRRPRHKRRTARERPVRDRTDFARRQKTETQSGRLGRSCHGRVRRYASGRRLCALRHRQPRRARSAVPARDFSFISRTWSSTTPRPIPRCWPAWPP